MARSMLLAKTARQILEERTRHQHHRHPRLKSLKKKSRVSNKKVFQQLPSR